MLASPSDAPKTDSECAPAGLLFFVFFSDPGSMEASAVFERHFFVSASALTHGDGISENRIIIFVHCALRLCAVHARLVGARLWLAHGSV